VTGVLTFTILIDAATNRVGRFDVHDLSTPRQIVKVRSSLPFTIGRRRDKSCRAFCLVRFVDADESCKSEVLTEKQ
jgi:hypothetical protein